MGILVCKGELAQYHLTKLPKQLDSFTVWPVKTVDGDRYTMCHKIYTSYSFCFCLITLLILVFYKHINIQEFVIEVMHKLNWLYSSVSIDI